jgi:tetratricopeptide (TPR) repeat protein
MLLLADCLHIARRGEEAEALFREGIRRIQSAYGDDHPFATRARLQLAALLLRTGRAAEAEPIFRRHLADLSGTDFDAGTLSNFNNLGYTLNDRSRYAEAEAYLRAAVDGAHRLFGARHRYTFVASNGLAVSLRGQGRDEQAEALYASFMPAARETIAGTPDFAVMLGERGRILARLGRHAEAELHLLEAHRTLERVLGADHLHTIIAARRLGEAYASWGRAEDAVEVLEGAAPRARRVFPSRAMLATLLHTYGRVLAEVDRLSEAESALLEAHDILSAERGADHGSARAVSGALADLYVAWDRPEDAAAWGPVASRP